jgi:hypothetical protein
MVTKMRVMGTIHMHEDLLEMSLGNDIALASVDSLLCQIPSLEVLALIILISVFLRD